MTQPIKVTNTLAEMRIQNIINNSRGFLSCIIWISCKTEHYTVLGIGNQYTALLLPLSVSIQGCCYHYQSVYSASVTI